MIVKTWDVFCDFNLAVDCLGWADGAGSQENAADARQRARDRKWKRTGGQDICPACQEAREEAREEARDGE